MSVKSYLSVLDHPQAVDVVQRMLCSRPRPLTSQEQGSFRSPDLCSHCSTVIDVLLTEQMNTGLSTSSNVDWTPHILQRMVRLFSLRESHALLSDISTTAMHNLLVLIELNVKTLPDKDVKNFIDNVEELSFVSRDEWTRYLIQRLKRHFLDSKEDQPFTGFMERDLVSSPSASPPVVDEPMEQDNPAAAEGSPDIITISDSEADPDMHVDNPDALSMTSHDADATSSPRVPQVESHVDNVSTAPPEENGENMRLVANLYEEWSASKLASQDDFNSVCSLSNVMFLKSLKFFDNRCLPEGSITVLSQNIMSLPSEMSYHNAVGLIRAVIFPMVLELKQSASRSMVLALCTVNSAYPDPMVQGLVAPLLQHQNFSAVHGNVLVKILEDSSTREQLNTVWGCLADIQVNSSGAPYSWSDDVASVALSLFQKGVATSEASVAKLVTTLQRNAMTLCKSSKFAKLVVQLCKSPQYRPLMCRFQSQLSEIVAVHSSILKSAMTREVKKLSPET